MSWVTPVTDRVLADITGRTSKGFFNVADWERIAGNIDVVKAMLDAASYLDIPLYSLTPPTITSIPSATSINQLVENIERLRLAAVLAGTIPMLPYNWLGGANQVAPDYTDVNAWEQNLEYFYTFIPRAVAYRIYCGVSSCGQNRLWQHRFG